jgi:hypothetical protein
MNAFPILVMVFATSLGACARSATIPLAQDTFQITTTAAPICGSAGAQKVAFRQAAVETIRRGYDRFIIVGGQAGATVVGTTPIVVQSLGAGGAIAYGGAPMVSHGQGLVVKMFKENEPGVANALSARQTLGPKWQELAAKDALTCFDD